GSLSILEVAFEEDCGTGIDCGDVLAIDELYYRLPLGLGFTATLGARWGQEDMFALWPSVYPADTVLNVMAANGAPAAYNKNIGPGVGLWWQQNGWSASALYVAANGDQADTAQGGLGSATSAATAAVQLGYAGEQWALAAIYSRIQAGVAVPGTTPFTAAEYLANAGSHTDAFGLSGYWQPAGSGWMPSISAGWGLNGTTYDSPRSSGSLATSQSWMVGLQWSDVLAPGNQLGMGVGQPVFATALRDGAVPHDQGYVWEWWLKLQLTDQITVTPALFYLSRPLGQETPSGEGLDQLGALIKTSFQF
ncbi:MAG: carbohydrate porin, partial [Cyanobacteriota bacterium]